MVTRRARTDGAILRWGKGASGLDECVETGESLFVTSKFNSSKSIASALNAGLWSFLTISALKALYL